MKVGHHYITNSVLYVFREPDTKAMYFSPSQATRVKSDEPFFVVEKSIAAFQDVGNLRIGGSLIYKVMTPNTMGWIQIHLPIDKELDRTGYAEFNTLHFASPSTRGLSASKVYWIREITEEFPIP